MRHARPALGLTATLFLLPASMLAASPAPSPAVPGASPSPGVAAVTITDRDWALVAYVAEDGGQAGPMAPAGIRFDADSVSGTAGCNSFSGSVAATGAALTITDLTVTEVACDPETAIQERAVLGALEEIVAYGVPDGDLMLLDGHGNTRLTYRALEGQTWVPMFAGDQPVPEAIVTLEFGNGEVSGQGPCNTFSGPVAVDGPNIVIGPLASTQMACPDLELEGAYFAALEAARSWAIDAGDLVLSDESGTEVLRLAAASSGD